MKTQTQSWTQTWWRCGWCLTALLLAACTPSFENPTTVIDLRLLAVSAEPPEVLIDVQALMATGSLPEPLPAISLSPLVVDPRGAGRPVAFRVEACVNDPNVAVMGGEQRPGRVGDSVSDEPCVGGVLVAAGTAQPSDAAGVVPFAVTFQPTLELLARAVQADPLGIELGLPILLTFTISAGDESVVAVKRVIFTPRLAPDHKPNANPVVRSFTYRGSREELRQPLDPAAPPLLPPRAELRLGFEPALAESYPARNFSLAQRRFYTEQVPGETLRYAFFATRGRFSPGNVNNDPSPLRNNPTMENETTYHAPDAGGPGLVDVFVVVRDERGGSSFTRTRLGLE
jgi:hypothetical protein